MAYKSFDIAGLGVVNVYKRRGSRSLRLSIRPDGEVRVTIPTWSPYAAGINFARSRQTWIEQHTQDRRSTTLTHGQAIGKAHHLEFVSSTTAVRPTTRIKGNEVIVQVPARLAISDVSVQSQASKASVRALRQQAEMLLPNRLKALAETHGFTYRSVSIKLLKSRWGSCDQHQNITLNLFLMQLPWELIDYVLLHELTHTVVMRHGAPFWSAMERVLPATPHRRKTIRSHHPSVYT